MGAWGAKRADPGSVGGELQFSKAGQGAPTFGTLLALPLHTGSVISSSIKPIRLPEPIGEKKICLFSQLKCKNFQKSRTFSHIDHRLAPDFVKVMSLSFYLLFSTRNLAFFMCQSSVV